MLKLGLKICADSDPEVNKVVGILEIAINDSKLLNIDS